MSKPSVKATAKPGAKASAKASKAKQVIPATKAREVTAPKGKAKPEPKKTAPSPATSTPKHPATPVVKESKQQATPVNAPANEEAAKQLQARQKTQQAALKVFDQALQAFHRQDYTSACEGFKRILKEFESVADVAARARDYNTICEQKLDKNKNAPKNSEALYNQGVYALNAGQYDKAAELLERAARMEPNSAYILYSLAAAQAQSNDADSAFDNLQRAIQLQDSLRIRARRDPDFSNVIDSDEFRRLVGIEVAPPLVL